MALFPGRPRWASTRKVKPIWISLKQETVGGSGISWAICKSAPRSRQITTPVPHHSSFFRPDAFPATQPITSKHRRQRLKVTLETKTGHFRNVRLSQRRSIVSTVQHPLNGPLSRTTQVSRTRKVKPIWILLEQETVGGSGIRWVVCKSAPRSRQITTPAPHHSVFTDRMPFLPPNQQRQSTEGKS